MVWAGVLACLEGSVGQKHGNIEKLTRSRQWLTRGSSIQCVFAGYSDGSLPDRTRWDGTRFYHTTESGVQFKIRGLFLEFPT